MVEVDPQDGDGRSTNGGSPDQARPVPPEMVSPLVAPGVKQPNDPAGGRVDPAQIRPLVTVAEAAIALPLNLIILDPVSHIQ